MCKEHGKNSISFNLITMLLFCFFSLFQMFSFMFFLVFSSPYSFIFRFFLCYYCVRWKQLEKMTNKQQKKARLHIRISVWFKPLRTKYLVGTVKFNRAHFADLNVSELPGLAHNAPQKFYFYKRKFKYENQTFPTIQFNFTFISLLYILALNL